MGPIEAAEELGNQIDDEPSPAATPLELHNGEEEQSQQISQPPVSPAAVPVSGADESSLECWCPSGIDVMLAGAHVLVVVGVRAGRTQAVD